MLEGREVLAVTGPQREKFLHNILSNDVQGRPAGQGCLAALMDVKGHLIALLRVLVTKDAILLETPPGRREAVERLLTHYRVGAPVRFASPPVQVLALLGPRSRDALATAGAPLPDLPPQGHTEGHLAGGDVRIARAADLPASGLAIHVPAEKAAEILDALRAAGAVPLTPDDLDTLRVEDGRPWYGIDVTEENLLHETGLLSEYHSPSKGCYVGQEVVARLEARGGNVNKMLRGLRLEGPVAAGATLTRQGKDVGRVTTAAVSPRLGPIAMAYVHRSCSDPGTAVDAGGVLGTVASLPLTG